MLKKAVIALALISLVLAGGAGTALAKDPYVVGFCAALTGGGSGTYAPMKDAFDLYFKLVNERGGINGHPVKILYENNLAQPSLAAAQSKKLITQDKVILLLNASLSNTFAPMVQVSKRNKVPIFFAGAVCPPEVYPPNAAPLEFCSTGFAAKYDSRFAMKVIKKLAKGPVKLSLVAMNIPVSRGEIRFAAELAKGMKDFEVTTINAIPPPTPDYTPFAAKIKDSGANWVYSWAPWVTQVKTLEALRKLGWEGNYIAYAHNPAESEMERLQDPKFYVFGSNALFADNTEALNYIKAQAAKAGTIYPYHKLTEGWVSAMVLEQILKNTPWPATPEKVTKAMSGLKVELNGLRGGPLVWTKGNHFRTMAYYRAYGWDAGTKSIKLVEDWTGLEVK